ncbi:MAG: hypothetical protein AB7G40_05580 [Hyphomonadaceae bacterium]
MAAFGDECRIGCPFVKLELAVDHALTVKRNADALSFGHAQPNFLAFDPKVAALADDSVTADSAEKAAKIDYDPCLLLHTRPVRVIIRMHSATSSKKVIRFSTQDCCEWESRLIHLLRLGGDYSAPLPRRRPRSGDFIVSLKVCVLRASSQRRYGRSQSTGEIADFLRMRITDPARDLELDAGERNFARPTDVRAAALRAIGMTIKSRVQADIREFLDEKIGSSARDIRVWGSAKTECDVKP